jgi:hypothetical protein
MAWPSGVLIIVRCQRTTVSTLIFLVEHTSILYDLLLADKECGVGRRVFQVNIETCGYGIQS